MKSLNMKLVLLTVCVVVLLPSALSAKEPIESWAAGYKGTANNYRPGYDISVRPEPATLTLSDDAKKARILKQAYSIQVPFIENIGQVKSEDVSFYAKTFGGTVFVERDGTLTYSFPVENKGGVVIKEIFTEKRIKIAGLKPSPTIVNYFIGKDEGNWKSNIPTYDGISFGKIYKGIDLTLRAYGNNVEKLFTVLPEEDPEIIEIKITGAKGLRVNERGELEVITELGTVKFTKPLAYQKIKGQKKTVDVAYVMCKGNAYGFKVGNYDKKRPLIIDPLLASTFIGGAHKDYGNSIAVDGTGNVYVTGYAGFYYPTTPGAYDDRPSGTDVFVSKLNSTLSDLLASTFIGGSSWEQGNSIAFDGTGNVYVTGYTGSSNYPTTTGAYDVSLNGNYDVFVSKLNSTLSDLLASTFIGGRYRDDGYSIAVDGTGNVYVTGQTYWPLYSGYPITSGPYGSGGSYDVFVSKLDSTLSSLSASTFIGGSSADYGKSIAFDGTGNVYVTGYSGYNYPTTPGAYDESPNGYFDVFVSKLNSSLSSLSASTFIGGSKRDYGMSIALDGTGNVYVTGGTESSNYATTPGAYDDTHNGDFDVFVSKLNSSLGSLSASTFIGGNDDEHGYSIALDEAGNVYLFGHTCSTGYPTTPGAYDDSYNGGWSDVFVSKLDSSLSSLSASTFIGGSRHDYGMSIALDETEEDVYVYVTGTTYCSNYPTTPGAYDDSYNGGWDVFISKFDSNLCGNTPACEFGLCDPVEPAPGIEITFTQVDEPGGNTDVVITDTGPPPPAGFKLGNPAIYYEITTTATYMGPVEVCINYSDISFGNKANVKLFHYENGDWVNLCDSPGSCSIENDIICATVDSLSYFGVFEPDNQPPVADAGDDIQIPSTEQPSTIIQGTATDPDSDPLEYRWVEVVNGSDQVLLDWSPVETTGEAYLELGTLVPALSIGTHLLRLDVQDEGGLSDSDAMTLTIDNSPPVPNAGDNMQILSMDQPSTVIQGTATDPDQDPMEYRWLEGAQVLLVWSSVGGGGEAYLDLGPLGYLSVGDHTLTLEVRDVRGDGSSLTASDDMILTVQNSPPEVQPQPYTQVVEIGVDPIVVAAQVADYDGDTISYEWLKGADVLQSGSVETVAGGTPVEIPDLNVPAGDYRFPLGGHVIEMRVSDGVNEPLSQVVSVVVQDTTAPSLSPVTCPLVSILWPPNHTLQPVTTCANAVDKDFSGSITLDVAVESSEPPDVDADGNTIPDYYIDSVTWDEMGGVIELRLRAERQGTGDGRIYTITITATDASGNSSVALLEVKAPHDKRKK